MLPMGSWGPNWPESSARNSCQLSNHPQWTLVGSDVAEQVRFEPLQGHTFQVGLSEGDFHSVFIEGPRTVLKIQLALDKESVKLFCLSAIGGIGFADLGLQRRLVGLVRVASQ